jgi:hypothetical protein
VYVNIRFVIQFARLTVHDGLKAFYNPDRNGGIEVRAIFGLGVILGCVSRVRREVYRTYSRYRRANRALSLPGVVLIIELSSIG